MVSEHQLSTWEIPPSTLRNLKLLLLKWDLLSNSSLVSHISDSSQAYDTLPSLHLWLEMQLHSLGIEKSEYLALLKTLMPLVENDYGISIPVVLKFWNCELDIGDVLDERQLEILGLVVSAATEVLTEWLAERLPTDEQQLINHARRHYAYKWASVLRKQQQTLHDVNQYSLKRFYENLRSELVPFIKGVATHTRGAFSLDSAGITAEIEVGIESLLSHIEYLCSVAQIEEFEESYGSPIPLNDLLCEVQIPNEIFQRHTALNVGERPLSKYGDCPAGVFIQRFLTEIFTEFDLQVHSAEVFLVRRVREG